MVEFAVYRNEKQEPKQEPVYLMLEEHADKSVLLVACNKRGKGQHTLLWLGPDGMIHLLDDELDDMGFKLDGKGHIKVANTKPGASPSASPSEASE